MMFLILIFGLFITSSLGAYYPPKATYQPPENQTPPPTGYVMVPQDRLEEVFAPKKEGPSLKELSDATLKGKQDLLKNRTDVATNLKDYTRAKRELKEAEDMRRAIEKLIQDRKKATDIHVEKLKGSVQQTKNIIKDTKGRIKRLRDGKKTFKKPTDVNEAERTAVGTEDTIAATETSLDQAIKALITDDPEYKP